MKMYSLLFSVQQRHILERGGALPSSISVQSETYHLCSKRPIRVALCMLANPVQSLIINLHFRSGSCLRVYYHSSDGWMITSNVSLSPLLPNHLGPFSENKSMSLHFHPDTTYLESNYPLRRNLHPPE